MLLLFVFSFTIKLYITWQQNRKIAVGYFNEEVDYLYNWTNYGKIWLAGMMGGFMGGLTVTSYYNIYFRE